RDKDILTRLVCIKPLIDTRNRYRVIGNDDIMRLSVLITDSRHTMTQALEMVAVNHDTLARSTQRNTISRPVARILLGEIANGATRERHTKTIKRVKCRPCPVLQSDVIDRHVAGVLETDKRSAYGRPATVDSEVRDAHVIHEVHFFDLRVNSGIRAGIVHSAAHDRVEIDYRTVNTSHAEHFTREIGRAVVRRDGIVKNNVVAGRELCRNVTHNG